LYRGAAFSLAFLVFADKFFVFLIEFFGFYAILKREPLEPKPEQEELL